MMTGNFCMRKYNKRIFAVFYDVIVALALKREFFTLIKHYDQCSFRSCRTMSGLITFNNSTPKTPIRRMDLVDLLYTNAELSYFVSNFVAMAKGVGRAGIYLISFNSPTPKTP